MDTKKITNEEILYLAEHAKYYNELLIKQCERMTAEECSRMMWRAAMDREREIRKTKITRIFMVFRITGIFSKFSFKK